MKTAARNEKHGRSIVCDLMRVRAACGVCVSERACATQCICIMYTSFDFCTSRLNPPPITFFVKRPEILPLITLYVYIFVLQLIVTELSLRLKTRKRSILALRALLSHGFYPTEAMEYVQTDRH